MENRRRQALVSVWDKTGLVEFARGLSGAGWQIWASGGTAAKIEEAGISVRRTEEITGIGSILGGRVKTLHPELHAAILAAGSDREDRIREGKPVFDLVAVDLYPFHKTACMAPDSSETIELVDIGGPSMARGAAKNWAHVISATGSDSFAGVLETVLAGTDDGLYRRKWLQEPFQ